ncbi:MAG: LysR family transcriptional regulator [Actinomycetota bacterium]|nr:LysR family transcriptional regulator [Actinomycetota bacterium]
MTLTQLEAFVLVARLGSVKAAARTLDVSEPAVSQAIAALRNHLGDPLIERSGSTMELTAAGERVVGIASRIVELAGEAETAVREAKGAPPRLRIVTTASFAEHVAPALLDAFSSRVEDVEVTVGVAAIAEMASLLAERLADVALGPWLPGVEIDAMTCEPIMRYRLVVVCGPGDELGCRERVDARALAARTWLVDPSAADPATDVAQVVARLGVPEGRVRMFPTQAAVLGAAAEGEGLALAPRHLVARELERGVLCLVRAVGTPLERMWYVTTRTPPRRSLTTTKLRRFLDTPEAVQAMHSGRTSVPAARFRPPVYVTIWS